MPKIKKEIKKVKKVGKKGIIDGLKELKKIKLIKSKPIIDEPIKAEKTEKEKLLELYQTLKDLNIRSLSDLENLIAKAE